MRLLPLSTPLPRLPNTRSLRGMPQRVARSPKHLLPLRAASGGRLLPRVLGQRPLLPADLCTMPLRGRPTRPNGPETLENRGRNQSGQGTRSGPGPAVTPATGPDRRNRPDTGPPNRLGLARLRHSESSGRDSVTGATGVSTRLPQFRPPGAPLALGRSRATATRPRPDAK